MQANLAPTCTTTTTSAAVASPLTAVSGLELEPLGLLTGFVTADPAGAHTLVESSTNAPLMTRAMNSLSFGLRSCSLVAYHSTTSQHLAMFDSSIVEAILIQSFFSQIT